MPATVFDNFSYHDDRNVHEKVEINLNFKSFSSEWWKKNIFSCWIFIALSWKISPEINFQFHIKKVQRKKCTKQQKKMYKAISFKWRWKLYPPREIRNCFYDIGMKGIYTSDQRPWWHRVFVLRHFYEEVNQGLIIIFIKSKIRKISSIKINIDTPEVRSKRDKCLTKFRSLEVFYKK